SPLSTIRTTNSKVDNQNGYWTPSRNVGSQYVGLLSSHSPNEYLQAGSKFSSTYQAPPGLVQMATALRASGQGVVVLSCSDPRLNPYQVLVSPFFLSLQHKSLGAWPQRKLLLTGIDATLKATMVRNAGGRAFDAIRSLAVLQTIGNPTTIVVMHHTDCGMTHFHDADFKKALIELSAENKSSIEGMKFGEITNGIESSIREDIAVLKASPLIKKTTQIVGLAYDIKTGALTEVTEHKSEL
ncbi:Uncharacterized protein LSUE1_G004365, partial [Lachnellula suecica]